MRGNRDAADGAVAAEAQTPEFIRAVVARGRLVIPANVRHLAGAAGKTGNYDLQKLSYNEPALGHPGARGDAANLWVNQTVSQRTKFINDPTHAKGLHSPKRLDPMAIGRMVTTKINANIGASPVSSGTHEEVEKLNWAQKYGADTLMDLSTGGDLNACRQAILDHSTIPIGTVPIYSMIIRPQDRGFDAGHHSQGNRTPGSRGWITSPFTRECSRNICRC